MTNRYDYSELRAKAISREATQEDMEDMARWFDKYDIADWNGEYYDLDGYKLRPIYGEDDDGEPVFDHWEVD